MNTFFIFSAEYLFVLPIFVLGAYFVARTWPAQKRMALFAVPAGVLTYLLGLIGNYLYYDPRPFVALHFTPLVPHAPDNGFPSDHTLLVSAVAMIGTLWNRRLGMVLWILAILVAIGRVYVGLHHVLDVIASMVFAVIATLAWYATLKYAKRA